ncbi:gag-pol polyprotein [Trifolium medium]|uniref:Gag-pol polyprotein n=1 Tax=Trifolium medium TaxID=97028 RepID=A0A392MPX7_9FABA|nr:gag-pol polyprotein [Trifolium medium]
MSQTKCSTTIHKAKSEMSQTRCPTSIPRAKSKMKTNLTKAKEYYECEGFGHIKIECPNYLKKQKKEIMITWSDSNEDEEETTNRVRAFTRKYETDNSSDEDLAEEELAETYRMMATKWE